MNFRNINELVNLIQFKQSIAMNQFKTLKRNAVIYCKYSFEFILYILYSFSVKGLQKVQNLGVEFIIKYFCKNIYTIIQKFGASKIIAINKLILLFKKDA